MSIDRRSNSKFALCAALCAACLLGGVAPTASHAADIYYIGPDGKFSDSLNWAGGVVPGPGTIAVMMLTGTALLRRARS